MSVLPVITQFLLDFLRNTFDPMWNQNELYKEALLCDDKLPILIKT